MSLKLKGIVCLFLLIACSYTQTCSTSSVSNLNSIASGIIQLGAPIETKANTQYSIPMTGFTLGLYA